MPQCETSSARASTVQEGDEAAGHDLYLAMREEARAAVRAAIERGDL